MYLFCVSYLKIKTPFRVFVSQRAKPDEDMFEIIKEATGHRIEDQVYDKPIPTLETPQPEAPVTSLSLLLLLSSYVNLLLVSS